MWCDLIDGRIRSVASSDVSRSTISLCRASISRLNNNIRNVGDDERPTKCTIQVKIDSKGEMSVRVDIGTVRSP